MIGGGRFMKNNNKIIDLLNELDMPFVIEKDVDYYDEVGTKLTLLKELLILLKVDDSLVKMYVGFRKNILELLRLYFKGNIFLAQTRMRNIIQKICMQDDKAKVLIKDSYVFEDSPVHIPFFRARLDAGEDGYKADEIGVVPFNFRTKVDTSRFSMPGFPCLYLGNTSYDCWLELGKPEDHRFNVAPVYLDDSQIVFDLVTTCDRLVNYKGGDLQDNKNFEMTENITIGFVKRLMLTICSSFRIKEQNRIFKSEYIIPQMIMISCQKLEMDGVMYYSCRNSTFNITAINIALYSKYKNNRFISKAGESDLSDHMFLGDAYNYSLFKQFNHSLKKKTSRLWIDKCKQRTTTNLQNDTIDYRYTHFYDFDLYLLNLWEEKQKDIFIKIDKCKIQNCY